MIDPIVGKIEANPRYHELKRKRNAFGWTLAILMLIVYFGYIALIAFNKPFLAQPIGNGVTTLGIPIGPGRRRRPRPGRQAGDELGRDRDVLDLRPRNAVDHEVGGRQDEVGR